MELTTLRGVEMIALDGGSLDVLDPETGEVLGSVSLPPGPVDTARYALLTRGRLVRASGCIVARPDGRNRASQHPEMRETAAVPDFIPSSGYREQLRLARMVEALVDRRVKERDHSLIREAQDAQQRLRKRDDPDQADDDDQANPAIADERTDTEVIGSRVRPGRSEVKAKPDEEGQAVEPA